MKKHRGFSLNYYNFSKTWRDGEYAGVEVDVNNNQIKWHQNGAVVWKSNLTFNINEKFYPTVTLGYKGMKVEVNFDEPFHSFTQ